MLSCASCFSKSSEIKSSEQNMPKSCPPGTSIAVWGRHKVDKVEYSMLMVISAMEKNKAEKGDRLLAG